MKSEAKEKWLTALRSGEFTQEHYGVGDVQNKHLCCLGVGAVALNRRIKRLTLTIDASKVLEKHGLLCREERDGKECWTSACETLIEMNDTDKKSFAEIADWIEQNVPTT